MTCQENRYYILSLLTLSYLVGELGHFLLSSTSRDIAREIGYGDLACFQTTNSTDSFCTKRSAKADCESLPGCSWQHTGLGMDYQVLAGPVFIAVFTVSGVLFGIAADFTHRLRLLSLAVVTYSLAICLTGLATSYWQLVVLRMVLAAGESACSPVMVSLITDLFSSKSCGTATGVLHFGVYLGFGLSQALGIHLTRLDLFGLSWRPVYVLVGIPGLVLALLLLGVSDPRDRERRKLGQDEEHHDEMTCLQVVSEKDEFDSDNKPAVSSFPADMSLLASTLGSPFILVLFLAAAARHCAGFTWAYNARLYFLSYYPEEEVALYLTLAPIVGGTIGVFFGGAFSDRVASKCQSNESRVRARLSVLGCALLLSSPLAASVLYLPLPWAALALLGYYLLAETWFGILFVTLVEVAPKRLKTSVLGVFLFMMNNTGGNLPVLLDPISKAVGYREALVLLFPSMMGLSGLLFLLSILPLRTHLASLKGHHL